MCTHPITICKSNNDFGLGSLKGITFQGSSYSQFHGYHSIVATVPCGKCIECLKRRQNDLATRSAREAAKRGSMQFLTLTYNNDTVPLSIRLERVMKYSGDVIHDYPATPLVRSGRPDKDASPDFEFWCRGRLFSLKPGPHARVITAPFFETEEELYRYEITPSLNRRDVRLWLKRCRVRYYREKGEHLPDFSYIVCGEMGPRTCRPHYHLAFFGLQRHHVSWMAAQWEYGFTNLKSVNAVNDDGTSGFEIASKYIGKYMSKGKFECDSVKCGLAQKPRLMISKGLGVDLPQSLINYYRCYGLFGEYDANTLIKKDTGERLTDGELNILFDNISKRCHIHIGAHDYALPHIYTLKLFYDYVKDPITGIPVYRATELRRLYSASLQCKFVDDRFVKFLQSHPGITQREITSACSEFVASSENARLVQERFDEERLQSFYTSSIF